MNVILLIVAVVLACLAVQAEINQHRSMRAMTTLLHQLTSYGAITIATNATVNEIQSDLFEIPDSPALLERADFKAHTEQALHIVRGEN